MYRVYSIALFILNAIIICISVSNNETVFCSKDWLEITQDCRIACHEELTSFFYDFTSYDVEIHCDFLSSWPEFSKVKVNFTPSEVNMTQISISEFDLSQGISLHDIAQSLGLSKVDNVKLIEPISHIKESLINNYNRELNNIRRLIINDGAIYNSLGNFIKFLNLHTLEISKTILLQKLQFEDFATLTNLVQLELPNNTITGVESGAFSNLSNLRILDMSWNKLRSVPQGIFKGLKRLFAVNLESNKLFNLPKDLFRQNKNLSKINLRNNLLRTLPNQTFKGLEVLTEVSLSKNRLSTLPADLFQGSYLLEYVYLDNNRLKEIPSEIFRDTSLKTLRLGYNRLTSLDPKIFEGLSNLMYLDVSGNPLKNIYPHFCGQFLNKKLIFSTKNSDNSLTVRNGRSNNNYKINATCNYNDEFKLSDNELLALSTDWIEDELSMKSLGSMKRNFFFIVT